jgi:hypothetical protein
MTLHNLTHYSTTQLDQLIMLVNSGLTEARKFKLTESVSTGEGFVKLLQGIKEEKEQDERRERISACTAEDIIEQSLKMVRP